MNMRTNKRAILTLTLSLLALLCFAQGNPVKFKASKKQVSDTEVQVMFTMSISKGWHVYSTGLPADGPVSATLHTDKAEGVKPIGGLQHIGREISEMDPIFGIKLRYFENNVTFVQKYKITGKTYNVKGYLEFGACNDEMCMPPTSVEVLAFFGASSSSSSEAVGSVRESRSSTLSTASLALTFTPVVFEQ